MEGKPTVQDVLRQFYPGYLERYTPGAGRAKAAAHILNCKTGAYGTNVSRCSQCGHIQIHPNLPKLLYIGFKLIPQIPYKIGV